MEIVTKVMEKSWKFVGKNVYEPWVGVTKAVFHSSPSRIWIRLYALLRSGLVKILAPGLPK